MAATHTIRLDVLDRTFDFKISGKQAALGALGVRHLWMEIPGVYDTDGPGNGASLVECFRALCLEAQARGEEEHPHDRQTYLLARLLPWTLTGVAARVMPDRPFGPESSRFSRNADAEARARLEEQLREPDPFAPDVVEFKNLTYGFLDMPQDTDDPSAAQLYEEVLAQLFDEPSTLLPRDTEAAVAWLLARWEQIKGTLYKNRRWKSDAAYAVLGRLSYESRACLHECYSDVWAELLSERGPLARQFGLAPADRVFLGLVHLVHKAPTDMPDRRFDLFHGHAFALHPAWGLLMRTPTGQHLVGQCVSAIAALPEVPEAPRMLAAARNLPAFRAMMNAAQKAVNVYADQRTLLAMERKPERPVSPEQFEKWQLSRSDRSAGMRIRRGWFSPQRLGEE